MGLEQQIADKAKEIHTDGYAMSIGEVLSLYRDGDIDIHPEFQRVFRWDSNQKSRLIESILLKIPVPPIFVSQRDDGVWDVIDGVQRLSTILQFVGIYRDHNDNVLDPLVLERTEYLPDLEGYRWSSEVDDRVDDERVFGEALQRDFKRSKLEFRIIRKESDANAKYDLFQRLNSGTQLSPQEARNCLLVMLNLVMFDEVAHLAKTSDFAQAVPLSERKEDEAYRQELVLRFFMQTNYDGSKSKSELPVEFGEYLTSWMRGVALNPTYELDSELFLRTFRVLNNALGEATFKPYNGTKHLGPFSISCYEFVTSGVAANLHHWEQVEPDELASRIRSIWDAPVFRTNSGTGVSPRRRVPRLVIDSREYFAANHAI